MLSCRRVQPTSAVGAAPLPRGFRPAPACRRGRRAALCAMATAAAAEAPGGAGMPSFTYAQGKFDIRQEQRCAVGSRLPMDDGLLLVLDEGASDPRTVSMRDLFGAKKVVMFGLPGAYTSICSSKHVPQYNERLEKLREAGVDTVACVSVNDPYVMREWAHKLGVSTDRVLMLADGEGTFHCKLGLLQHIPGLGVRAMRYSALVDDGIIKILNVEEPGGKSYKVSGPDNMLSCIAALNKGDGAAA